MMGKIMGLKFFSVVGIMFFLGSFLAADNVYTSSWSQEFDVQNDPFSDFDDMLTENEQREELHNNLKQILSSHKKIFTPPSKNSAGGQAGGAQGTGQSEGDQAGGAQGTGPSEGDQAGGAQGTGQSEGDQAGGAQGTGPSEGDQAGGAQGTGPSEGDQAGGAQGTGPSEGDQAGGAQGTGPSEGDQIKVGSNPGLVSLEPMLPEPAPSKTKPNAIIKSRPAENTAGNRPVIASNFLKKYSGGQGQEKGLAEIANRWYNANGSSSGNPGNPGNVGKTQPKYNSVQGAVKKSQTVKADSGVIRALKLRMSNETDVDTRNKIQVEIDRLQN